MGRIIYEKPYFYIKEQPKRRSQKSTWPFYSLTHNITKKKEILTTLSTNLTFSTKVTITVCDIFSFTFVVYIYKKKAVKLILDKS